MYDITYKDERWDVFQDEDLEFWHGTRAGTKQLIDDIKAFGRAKNERDTKIQEMKDQIEANNDKLPKLDKTIKSLKRKISDLEEDMKLKSKVKLAEDTIKEWKGTLKGHETEANALKNEISRHKKAIVEFVKLNQKVPTFHGPMSWTRKESVGQRFAQKADDKVGTMLKIPKEDMARMLEIEKWRKEVGVIPHKWLEGVTDFDHEDEFIFFDVPAALVGEYMLLTGSGKPTPGFIKGKAYIKTWQNM